jgi:hypothetical protein
MSKFSAASATATGADAIITVPSDEKWRVKCALADLNASGASNNRQMSLEATVNSLTPIYVPSAFIQTGGHIYYAFGPGLPTDTATVENDDIRTGFPEVVLGPGDKIRTAVNDLDGSDVVGLVVNYEAELV